MKFVSIPVTLCLPVNLVAETKEAWNVEDLDDEKILAIQGKLADWAQSHIANIADAVSTAVMDRDMKMKALNK